MAKNTKRGIPDFKAIERRHMRKAHQEFKESVGNYCSTIQPKLLKILNKKTPGQYYFKKTRFHSPNSSNASFEIRKKHDSLFLIVIRIQYGQIRLCHRGGPDHSFDFDSTKEFLSETNKWFNSK